MPLQIAECLERAGQALTSAAGAPDPVLRQEFEMLAKAWQELAEHLGFRAS